MTRGGSCSAWPWAVLCRSGRCSAPSWGTGDTGLGGTGASSGVRRRAAVSVSRSGRTSAAPARGRIRGSPSGHRSSDTRPVPACCCSPCDTLGSAIAAFLRSQLLVAAVAAAVETCCPWPIFAHRRGEEHRSRHHRTRPSQFSSHFQCK